MYKFDPRNAARLEDPERRRIQDPAALIRYLAVQPGMVVLDVGAGTGFFTEPLAEAVGPEGHVYALDVNETMLAHLAERFADTANVTVRQSTEGALPLPDASADVVLLANVFHELEEYSAFLAEVRRVLRPGGLFALMDWHKDGVTLEKHGPPQAHRVSKEDAAAALRGAGFAVSQPETPEFPYHYLLLAKRTD